MRKLALCLLLLSMICIPRGDSPPAPASPQPVAPHSACTSFCLDTGDHCLFGSNQDNRIDAGLLFVNPRHLLKTAWDPSTSGDYAQWIARYGSLTAVHAGCQMAWAGMNEAGLMISTMALGATENPVPDERPPIASSFWVQYQLDNHSTVDEVLASQSQVRIDDTVDHYLVCDRTGDCVAIEFLQGEMVVHRGDSLPVQALTNSTYEKVAGAWLEGRTRTGVTVHSLDPNGPLARSGIQAGDLILTLDGVELTPDSRPAQVFPQVTSAHQPGDEIPLTISPQGTKRTVTITVELASRITEEGREVATLGMLGLTSGSSADRFFTAADRLQAFEPGSSEEAISYAFATLEAVAQPATAWSIVMDPAERRFILHTNGNRQVRFVDLDSLDFSCDGPTMMLDIHAPGSGNISDDLVPYDHQVSLDHTLSFLEQYERLDLPPLLVEALLGGLERFPCLEGQSDAAGRAGHLLDEPAPLLPVRVQWVGLLLLRRLGPAWALLTLLSLTVVIWLLTRLPGLSKGRRLMWVVLVALAGPFGLLIHLLARRRRSVKEAA